MTMFILTGPIGSGKTTRLEKWASDREDVSGVLMPVKNGRRCVVSLRSGEARPAEAGADTPSGEIIRIGKYVFRKCVFEWGCKEILTGFCGEGITVIDETGPLEIMGEGFFPALQYILNLPDATAQKDLVLVVREGLVSDAVRALGIKEYRLIHTPSEIDAFLNRP